MACSSGVLLTITALMIIVLSSPSVHGGGDHSLSWVPTGGSRDCQGSVEECMGEGEYEMESEISRRILATSQYISYQAMQRNSVPCSQRGASYSNCQGGTEANPYNRGCSDIARCRS